MFAKIFESEKHGQLCAVAASENEDSLPEVRVYFMPEGLGVCTAALKFKDTEAGWNQQEKLIKELTLFEAEVIIGPTVKALNEFFEDEKDS